MEEILPVEEEVIVLPLGRGAPGEVGVDPCLPGWDVRRLDPHTQGHAVDEGSAYVIERRLMGFVFQKKYSFPGLHGQPPRVGHELHVCEVMDFIRAFEGWDEDHPEQADSDIGQHQCPQRRCASCGHSGHPIQLSLPTLLCAAI